MHARNSIATSTPTVDGERLYLAWATPGQYMVQAPIVLDRQRKSGKRTSAPIRVSTVCAPVLYEDLLILSNEQDKKGSLHAPDTKTGNKVWKVPRNSGNATYSTPCI